MKILFVQDSLGTGGAERSNAEFWYYLSSKDVNIKIVVLEHRAEGVEREVLSKGFDVIFLEGNNFVYHSKQIAGIIKEFQPDFVHSVLHKATLRVRMAKVYVNFYHIESLVSCPYDEIRLRDSKVNPWGLKFYKWLDRLTQIKGTDGFIAITREVKQHYINHLNIPESKIRVIYRGRQENVFLNQMQQIKDNMREELELNPGDLIFMHVGRQEYAKDHITLLKAIKEVDDFLKTLNVKFLLCGRKGNASNDIEEFYNSANFKTEVSFLGHRDDIYKLLVISNVFVFPSLYEGLGGALIEAQAAGKPIICSNLNVFHEVVHENKNALMFQAGDFKDLSEKLKILAGSRQLREEMGNESLLNFHERFLIEEIHQQMFNYYHEIISHA